MEEHLPRFVQGFLTELTGKAGPNQQERFRHTTKSRILLSLGQFAVGIVGGGLLVHAGGLAWLLTPVALVLTAGAARAFQTTYLHHASHGNLCRTRRGNDLLGEAVSVLAWLAPLAVYREEHKRHHHQLATGADPDLKLVLKLLRFRPGLSRRQYWQHLSGLLATPRFHLAMTLVRLKANLIDARGWRLLASWAQLLGLVGAVTRTGLWGEILVAYVVPITVIFDVGAVLQALSEHTWVRTGQGRDPERVVWSRLTRNRFFGELPPEPGSSSLPWIRWWFRMLTVHGFFRILVVPLDLAVHQWHHVRPQDTNWPRSAFAYRDGRGPGSASDQYSVEVWGLLTVLNLTFDYLGIVPLEADLADANSYGFIDPNLLEM
jgi:uncharacterized membrane protein YoaK (UPF0700 family)